MVDYHLTNGGVSRFVKFSVIYSEILNKPLSEKKFQFLCDEFSSIVVDEVVAAPWVEGARGLLENNKDRYFCEVLGSPKNKETLLEGALSRLKLFPEETVFVGDAETDWSAAKKLGVAFLWRRVPSDSPLLTGYAGPQLISLSPLEENLKILQKEMTL